MEGKILKKVFFNNNLPWCNIFLTYDLGSYNIAYGMLYIPTNKPRNLSVIKNIRNQFFIKGIIYRRENHAHNIYGERTKYRT
jgi:hypothetical protein